MQVDETLKVPASAALNRRSRSHLLLLDSECRIVLGEMESLRLLFPDVSFGSDGRLQLSAELCSLVKRRVAAIGSRDAAILVLENRILRLVPLTGPLGTFTAISIEGTRRREDLIGQVATYRLSPREVDVLKLILQGLTAIEIAQALSITRNTVADYFKNLVRKTESRNRSEMISKVLGWNT
jgi:DNA-binding CsgD family transcriptional regulator